MRLLSTKNVALMLDIPQRTVESWRRYRTSPFKWVKVGRMVRYYAEDVESYVRRNTIEPSVRANVSEDRNVRL